MSSNLSQSLYSALCLLVLALLPAAHHASTAPASSASVLDFNFDFDFDGHSQPQSLIDAINGDDSILWNATTNPIFYERPYSFVQSLCGTRGLSHRTSPDASFLAAGLSVSVPVKRYEGEEARREVPREYDARQAKGDMCPSLWDVRNQGNCGSCWAFGATEAMTDRHCLATNGAEQPYLASSDPLSCCSECGSGCDGGTLPEVWQYWLDTGIVTGGAYGSNATCFPYQFPSCSHHIDDPAHSCSAAQTVAEACPTTCPNTLYTAETFSGDKQFGQSAYQLTTVRDIQLDILHHGPVEAAFMVYSDFPSYQSGVYHKTVQGEAALGGHAIVLKGWGVDSASGVEYWLCVNSWDRSWGDAGSFKIRRGVNECGIEEMVYAGLPAVGNEAAKKRAAARK